MEKLSVYLFMAQYVCAVLGFFMNIPHLIILSQNSMRTSSTNSLLIGIAISNVVVTSRTIFEKSHSFIFAPRDNVCILNTTYFYELTSYIMDILHDTCDRCTFIFGVFLVLIRLIVMKFKHEDFHNFCRPITGYLIVVNFLFINFLITGYNYLKWKVIFWDYWVPPGECTGYPANYTAKIYFRYIKEADMTDFLNNYMFVNGVVRIVLAVVYPILAMLLFWEIRKCAKFAAGNLSAKEAEERYRTALMILLITVCFVITTAPMGLTNFIQYFMDTASYPILESVMSFSNIVVSILCSLNAMSQCLINYVMSTNYRKTVKSVFCCEREEVQISRMFSKPSTASEFHY